VAVVDVNADGARKVASEIGGVAVPCDLAREADVQAMVAESERRLGGPVDVLFNNAGVATGGDPLSTPISVWDSQWQINVMSHVYAARAVLPAMLARRSGYLLHTASMAGILTSQGNLTYAVTKHAVVGFVRAMAAQLEALGISINAVNPGIVETPLVGEEGVKLLREAQIPMMEPSQIADAGQLAGRFFLTGGGGGAAASGRLASLYGERTALDERIQALKKRKAALSADAYDTELENILLELARKSREIRALEKGS
jgi:NAD(P)-dependent dehydrogenase (short-subunit alcohol dehydrogenase family)